ncbi:hypothetical protein BDW72DRAFT_193055 [Aspergillus terricola var. indicus]
MLQSSQSAGLNVIALISGGKDSLYSILHCIRNGHKVVALANLHPSPIPANSSNSDNDSTQPETADDIDSFMYQTIGWSVIPLYEEALGIPLYRAPITGGAVDAGRVYRDTNDAAYPTTKVESAGKDEDEDEDETESLVPLLRKVMAAHPEANAVCAGAILSTYQRTRIEDIAGRLGLVPLAWLWQYPFLPAPEARRQLGGEEDEAGLLTDMAVVGCSARIVKVASGALDEGFLWGDVSDVGGGLRRRIVKGVKRFGMGGVEDIRGAVLGEGGEYETLAVDGPGFLWRGRIEIPEEEREVRSGEGGVGYLRLKEARVIMKSEDESDGVTPGDVRRPALLDRVFSGALDALRSEDEGEEGSILVSEGSDGEPWPSDGPIQSVNGGIWTVSNLIAPEAGPGAAEQMAAIVKKIQAVLGTSVSNAAPRTTADIVFTTVLLRSMADFPSMNGIYVSLFEKPNPPARATVACGDRLPDAVNVMVSMVVDLGPRGQRDGLHVQSRSYWAPANIGPYSQAISVPSQGMERVVYIAGQIPLEPASMDLVEVESLSTVGGPLWAETFCLRAVLSLQHMWRIGATMGVNWWLGTVAYFTGEHHIKTRARLAWELWLKMHEVNATESEEEEDEGSTLDVWDIKYGRRGYEHSKTAVRPSLPSFELVEASDSKNQVPAFFAVQVHELPRNSDIEWQGLGYRCEGVKLTKTETEFGRTTDATTSEGLKYSCIEIDCASAEDLKAQVQRVMEVYTPSQPDTFHCVIYSSQPLSQDCCQGQIVPCKSVWGTGGKEVAAGVIIQGRA